MQHLNSHDSRFRQSHRIMGVFALCIGLLSGLANANGNVNGEQHGITLGSTRVIYPGDAKNGITYTLTNNTLLSYLMQTQVSPWEYDVNTDNAKNNDDNQPLFIALPPLQRFEPNDVLTLRILLTRNTLPQDRESLFLLSLKAIPAQQTSVASPKASGAQLVMAIQNNLKLFYRPADLPLFDIAKVEEKLVFQRNTEQLTIKNPSPFYVTFNKLSVGNSSINLSENRMISPFSQQSWPLLNTTATDVHWQLINDVGQTEKETTRVLSRVQSQ
nr:molecular chaperone [uncultured Moellerella sp.]